MTAALVWLDGQPEPESLLDLAKVDGWIRRLVITEFQPPELSTQGEAKVVPGTSAQVFTGYRALKPGVTTVTLQVFGPNRAQLQSLARMVKQAAMACRALQLGGRTLPIVCFLSIKTTFYAQVSKGAVIEVTFAPGLAYWLRDVEQHTLVSGVVTSLSIDGDMNVPLRLSITAGAAAVINPSVLSDAGLTTWTGSIPPGQTLLIDASPGRWSVTLGSTEVRTSLRGPQPFLRPGDRLLTITAPGAAITAQWQPGEL